MANEVRVAVCASQFEVPVVGREPCVEHFGDINATVSKSQRAWRLLTTMTGVALDTNREEPVVIHRVIRQR